MSVVHAEYELNYEPEGRAAEDAWELVRTIARLDTGEKDAMYGRKNLTNIIQDYSYTETKAIYEHMANIKLMKKI